MESVLLKANLVILSTGQYWLIFNGEEGMSDREGHGHKAVVCKSHFLPLRHSVVTETPADTLANKPRLLQRPSSLLFMPPTTLTYCTFHEHVRIIKGRVDKLDPIGMLYSRHPLCMALCGLTWNFINLTFAIILKFVTQITIPTNKVHV